MVRRDRQAADLVARPDIVVISVQMDTARNVGTLLGTGQKRAVSGELCRTGTRYWNCAALLLSPACSIATIRFRVLLSNPGKESSQLEQDLINIPDMQDYTYLHCCYCCTGAGWDAGRARVRDTDIPGCGCGPGPRPRCRQRPGPRGLRRQCRATAPPAPPRGSLSCGRTLLLAWLGEGGTDRGHSSTSYLCWSRRSRCASRCPAQPSGSPRWPWR